MFWMIIVWIHLIAAMFWIGGMLFFSIVLIPSLKGTPTAERKNLVSRIGRQFRMSGWIALGLLIVTGIVRLYHRGIPLHSYGSALLVKLLLVLVMVSLTLLHDFILGPKSMRMSRTTSGSFPLQNTVRWMARFNLLVGLFVVLAAVYMGHEY